MRTFTGSEIRTSLVEAFEALDEDVEIAEVSAGENMTISVTAAFGHNGLVSFRVADWNGEEWVERP